MNGPDHGDHHRQRHRAVAPAAPEPRRAERQPQEMEECQGRDHVNQQVHAVVTKRLFAPDGMVDRKREVGERPGRQLVAHKHRVPGREQPLHRRIPFDLVDVIEDEPAPE